MLVLAECHGGSCDASVVSFDFGIPTETTCPFGFNFNLSFKSPRRYQARLVSIGAGTPGDTGAGAAPGLQRRRRCPLESWRRRRRDYIITMAIFTISVTLLGVKVVNPCRHGRV